MGPHDIISRTGGLGWCGSCDDYVDLEDAGSGCSSDDD